MACSSGCPSQSHKSYGECMRSKGVRIPEIPVAALSVQKKADRNLDDYAKARKYGIQPQSTNPTHVQQAIRTSEQTGTAFQA